VTGSFLLQLLANALSFPPITNAAAAALLIRMTMQVVARDEARAQGVDDPNCKTDVTLL
jgi:hypothetical protein